MTIKKLIAEIHRKKSFLCIGLDTDMDKIPPFLLKEADPIFAFNKAIIDATHHLCVAYKPNTAFYEAYGIKGWKSFEKTISYLNKNYPEIFTIADAKRGDIGNTSRMYAKVFFQDMGFDSVTVAPYMGKDSVEPFLKFDNKHTILLALTSNQGAFDFQTKLLTDKALYQHVLEVSKSWVNSQNLMYVFGATKAEFLVKVRDIMPDNFLLVPGVGAQGGNLKDISKYGMNDNVGLLVNSSRAIIYASADEDFAQMAANSASKLQEEMKKLLFQKFTSLKN
jgi:orotidine-5'-phosphate decarboxylase|tara:strand:+ start:1281 stop:2117 length:837 start_codon:yes stop_codon:yes gene_type:complete